MYSNEEHITETEVIDGLRALLCGDSLGNTLLEGNATETYSDAGYLTCDEGFIIRTPDGSVFQVTIKQEQ